MIDTLLRLWPLIVGGAAAGWRVTSVLADWWRRRKHERTTKQQKADEIAEQALDVARAKIDAAVQEHTDWLERELTRAQNELAVARASEQEAWRRAAGLTHPPDPL